MLARSGKTLTHPVHTDVEDRSGQRRRRADGMEQS